MKKNIVAWLALIPLLISACASAPKSEPAEPVTPPPEARSSSGPARIDMDALQTSLGLDSRELGFKEKSFDSCQVGYGFSSSQDCHKGFYAIINFQLQCRDSDGTVSDVDYVVTPVVSDHIKWNLAKQEGFTATDSEGRGQVRVLTRGKTASQKLRLTIANDFLLLNAGDVKRIVAPKSWCEHR